MPPKLVYFVGCAANYLEPAIAKAAIGVLKKNGFDVLVPEQNCCGLPHLRYGAIRRAQKFADTNIRSLTQFDSAIVTTCPSCAFALRHLYPRIINSHAANEVASRIYGLVEYLARLHEQGDLDTRLLPLELSLVYHAPCHLKGIGEELLQRRFNVMRLIPGLALSPHGKGCCGMGGSFGATRLGFSLSLEIGKPALTEIARMNPQGVSTECPACKLQISQVTNLPVVHPVLLLAWAYGLAPNNCRQLLKNLRK